jgi:flagellar basal body rod protein FlgB
MARDIRRVEPRRDARQLNIAPVNGTEWHRNDIRFEAAAANVCR